MKRYQILLLAGLVLASCGREELPGPVGNGSDAQIRFEIGIAPPESAGLQADPQTRVVTDENFKCAWQAGDTISLYAYKEDTDFSQYYVNNVKLIYDGTAWTPEKPLYWPGDGKKLRFFAFYPYSAKYDPEFFYFMVKEDQSADTDAKSNLDLSDLMLTMGVWTAKGEPIDLVFSKHYMGMVQLELDDHYATIGGDEVSVTMSGVARECAISSEAWDWVPETGFNVGDVRMRRVEQPGDPDYRTKYTFRAIVPMQLQNNKGKSLFRIRIGTGLLDSSKLKADFSVSAGEAYRYIEKIPAWRRL